MGRSNIIRRVLALAGGLALCLFTAGASDPSPPPSGGTLVETTLGIDIPIQGAMTAREDIICVTLPVEIPFLVLVDDTGNYIRLLAASNAAVKNRSASVDVALSVADVTDPGGYLDKLTLTLTGDRPVTLEVGMDEKPLGTVAAEENLPLSLSGSAKAPENMGSDGETFKINFLVKVSKING